MALNAVGDIGRGQSILDATTRAGESQRATTASSPTPSSPRDHSRQLVGRTTTSWATSTNLLTQLPASEGVRRVQLACWAAHQLLLRGDRLRAEHLLDTADGDAYGGWQLQGLIQAVRAQADTLVGSGPEAARRSLSELRRWAASRSDLTAEAAACLLGARQAWADGTLADVTEVRRDIAAVATRCHARTCDGGPTRWTPPSSWRLVDRVAPGRPSMPPRGLDASSRSKPRPRPRGRNSCCCSSPMANSDRRRNRWRTLASQSDAPIATVAAYGLACAEAGDTEAAVKTAARLAAAPNLLVRAGASWPLVAMCASTTCFVAADTALRAKSLEAADTPSRHRAWPCTRSGTSGPSIAAWGCSR